MCLRPSHKSPTATGVKLAVDKTVDNESFICSKVLASCGEMKHNLNQVLGCNGFKPQAPKPKNSKPNKNKNDSNRKAGHLAIPAFYFVLEFTLQHLLNFKILVGVEV